MKTLLGILIFLHLSYGMLAQEVESDGAKAAMTIGILEGGGSLVGADLEVLLGDNVGIQVGSGFVGYGAGFNVHFEPTIKSSFISAQYWHQGGNGDSFSQSVIGLAYVYRGKKWFTAQIGGGVPTKKGPAWPDSIKQPSFMLTYAIGGYFTLGK